MSLKKYTKEDLIKYGKEGWNIIPCKDEADVNSIVETLDKSRVNNIPGYVTNKENTDIPFVLVLRPLPDKIKDHQIMVVKKERRGRPKKVQVEQPTEQPTKAKRGRPKREVK